jgi:hypothetical protein
MLFGYVLTSGKESKGLRTKKGKIYTRLAAASSTTAAANM